MRLMLAIVLAAGLGGCVTTESAIMPTSGLHVDVASISGDGLTPPATVVCVEKVGCQTGFGQSIVASAMQGVVGSAIGGEFAFKAANVATNHSAAASVQNTVVKVTANGGSAVATGGNAANTNTNSSMSTSN